MNNKNFILNCTFIFILEIIFHLLLFKSIDLYLFYSLGFSIIVGTIITLICYLFSEKINKIFNIILLSIIDLIFVSQLIHFKFYSSIFSIYSLVNGGQVFGFMSAIMKVFFENIFAVILLIIPLILVIIFIIKLKSEKDNTAKLLFIISISLIVLGSTVLSLKIDPDNSYNADKLYRKIHVPTLMTKKFGLLTTMRLDLQRSIFGFEEEFISNKSQNNKKDETTQKVIEYNKLDIDFEQLILNEKNEKIKKLHTFFNNENATEKNEYTGIFKDKNLIVMVAEAFSPIAIDKELTPTLYKLYNEGFKFNNFYTPLYYVSTSDGEYISLTSLLPKEGVWSFQESSKIELPFVYGNMFKKEGYTARAYHNGEYTYYNRHLSHPNMGYKYLGCYNGLEKRINCRIWPQSDLEMINATFNDYKNDNKFLTYYMTISGHLNYTYYGNMMATKNKSQVKNLPYSESIQAYMATHIELDKALESLISKLKNEKLLEDTVIVISADHYPYGLSVNELKEKADYIKDQKFDIHKNNLIIWNSELNNPITVDKYASSLDILPTVLNLFGMNYDSRLLAGKDIFSSSDGLVIFSDRSWITDYGKYNSIAKKFTAFKEIDDEENYIKSINNIVYNRFSFSRSILENNYYKYLNLNK